MSSGMGPTACGMSEPVSTETADPTGRLSAYLDPAHVDGGAVVVVFGAVSGITVVQERA